MCAIKNKLTFLAEMTATKQKTDSANNRSFMVALAQTGFTMLAFWRFLLFWCGRGAVERKRQTITTLETDMTPRTSEGLRPCDWLGVYLLLIAPLSSPFEEMPPMEIVCILHPPHPLPCSPLFVTVFNKNVVFFNLSLDLLGCTIVHI